MPQEESGITWSAKEDFGAQKTSPFFGNDEITQPSQCYVLV